MPTIPDLCHDIANCLNSITIISGVLRDALSDRDLPQDIRDELITALQKTEASSLKAGGYLDELRVVLKEKGEHKRE